MLTAANNQGDRGQPSPQTDFLSRAITEKAQLMNHTRNKRFGQGREKTLKAEVGRDASRFLSHPDSVSRHKT
jgi:hypothetical protein